MENIIKETLVEALRTGGKILLEYFDKPVKTHHKESQSNIVTEADMKSDSMIVSFIADRFPEHNIISEESGFNNKMSRYTWVIDPLDGTSNFAASIPWFGVLISLFEGNIPVLGGAFLPSFNVLYFAERGKGSLRNGKTLILDANKDLKNSLIAFSVDYTEDEAFLNKGISIYKHIIKNARNIRSTNSLIDFICVAEGKFGGCINLYTRIWDISALELIISEAGGVMLDIVGNEIKYSIDNDIINRNFSVISGSKKIVESLIRFSGGL